MAVTTLAHRLEDFDRALARLQEAYDKTLQSRYDETYPFFRDSTIQRFVFTLEIAWKSVKSFLESHEGLLCRSPKSCLRELMAAGYLDADDWRWWTTATSPPIPTTKLSRTRFSVTSAAICRCSNGF